MDLRFRSSEIILEIKDTSTKYHHINTNDILCYDEIAYHHHFETYYIVVYLKYNVKFIIWNEENTLTQYLVTIKEALEGRQ